MPGEEALGYGGVRDLYPRDEEEHALLLKWFQAAFLAAESARRPYYERWKRYYRQFRSYHKRPKGSWRSHVFYPIVFYVVETVAPRLVASLPSFTVAPVSRDDVDPAEQMEALMGWAVQNSDLYVELVKAVKDALVFGTGILKVFWDQKTAMRREKTPRIEPVIQTFVKELADPETGERMYSLGGEPITETTQEVVGHQPVLNDDGSPVYDYTPQTYVIYEGPSVEAIDTFNMFVAPESPDVEQARYVIQRSYQPWSYVLQKVKEGVYHLPDWMETTEVQQHPDEPIFDRLESVELDEGHFDSTRKDVEILECWTNDHRVMTMVNRRAIVRHTENPYDHGQKPYVRVLDIMVPHEFWGMGEVEPLEGLQDHINALGNQRIDNVRLVLDRMFAVNINHLVSKDDLQVRPGGVIRIQGDMDPRQVVYPMEFGDVTSNAYEEVQYAEQMVEKVSGVSPFQLGTETPHVNRTATGASLMNEASNSRFGLKTRLFELVGLRPLARMWGALFQQFIDQPKVIRVLGDEGNTLFKDFTPESIQGALDFDIEAQSSVQTESVRKDQAMTLLQIGAQIVPEARIQLFQDVLKVFGIKAPGRYISPPQPPMMPGMQGPGMPPNGQQLPPEVQPLFAQMQQGPPQGPMGGMNGAGEPQVAG